MELINKMMMVSDRPFSETNKGVLVKVLIFSGGRYVVENPNSYPLIFKYAQEIPEERLMNDEELIKLIKENPQIVYTDNVNYEDTFISQYLVRNLNDYQYSLDLGKTWNSFMVEDV